MTHKLCSRCDERQAVKPKKSPQWCQPCSNEYERERWNSLPPEKRRDRWLKYKYGIGWEEYEKIHIHQNGMCAICFDPISITATDNGQHTACVDHDHETGRIRGLLCNHCNRALGLLKDSIGNLESAIKYLEST